MTSEQPNTPQRSSKITATPSPEPSSLPKAPKTPSNDSTMDAPKTPASATTGGIELSPADVRTLQKILDHLRTPSPLASPAVSDPDESVPTPSATDDGSSDAGGEDTVSVNEVGDERDNGYEDEDDSMELSEDEVPATDADASDLGRADTEHVSGDGDTMEDMMNTPGKTAPAAPELDEAAAEDDGFGPDAISDDDEDGRVPLPDNHEFNAPQPRQAKTGMRDSNNEEDDIVELEPFAPEDRRSSRLFSPKPTNRHSRIDARTSTSPFDPKGLKDSKTLKAYEERLGHPSSPSLSEIPSVNRQAVLRAMKLQGEGGKENSPSKSRRNASLPEEIAQLAREANEEDEEVLNRYRDLDLAPMEPVTEAEEVESEKTEKTDFAKETLSTGSEMDEELGEEVYDLRTLSPQSSRSNVTARPLAKRLPVEQDTEDDADAEASDTLQAPAECQPVLYREDPTFVKVVGMLPQALFWAAAARVAKLGNVAYDALVERFASLEVKEGEEQ